ncbi:uncharacterized protein N7511_002707 [Penicillium nucicola]|uniref:uncharacterized protein n=1 Tax=Penicillium nucicola TaxID=1850975 RepID=UPI002544F16D|nr:uncharacterized protein N7511_002707 [Penicillium nucicola]KAJ5770656.1 hypothetical protein N7511_002707 [Penicillium nucicola]
MNNETQIPVSDCSGLVDLEGPPASAWSPTMFINDQLGWDELLQDIPEQPSSLETERIEGRLIKTPCQCFSLALQTIKKLDRYHNLDAHAVDSVLGVTQEAVKICRHFYDCVASCHHSNILLHVTILQLLDTHYASIGSWLMSTAEAKDQKLDVEVGIGAFHLKARLHSIVGRAILSSEIMGTANCAMKLFELFRVYAFESSMEELKCQRDLLQSLTTSLYQSANDMSFLGCTPDPLPSSLTADSS